MLVSIIVITYNSSSYVIKTLESAYRQSYSEIELILSDDCSTDNTFTLCKQWIAAHQSRFVRALATQTPINKGICGNYNHATSFSQGKYIKFIAGDDVLADNCIERFVAHIQENIHLYFSAAIRITEKGNIDSYLYCAIPSGNATQQLRAMLKYHPMVFGPCIFIERKHLLALGGFDEQYPMSEDYPILMKFLTHGYSCNLIQEPLVLWRMHGDSVSASPTWNFKGSVSQSVTYYSRHYCWRYGLIFTPYHDWVDLWIPKHYNRGFFYRTVGYCLRLLDVVHIKRKIFGGPRTIISSNQPL